MSFQRAGIGEALAATGGTETKKVAKRDAISRRDFEIIPRDNASPKEICND